MRAAAGYSPAASRPFATAAVCVLSLWVFAWQLALGAAGAERVSYAFGMIPAVLTGQAELPASAALLPPPWTLLTSLFVHASGVQVLANVCYLWLFGSAIESCIGSPRFLGFHCLCGVFAALTQLAFSPQSVVPMVGAGGAVSGAIGGYFLLYPRGGVTRPPPLHIGPAPVAASALLGLWITIQFATAAATPASSPGVAWFAHVGGFLAGAVLILLGSRRHAGAPRGRTPT